MSAGIAEASAVVEWGEGRRARLATIGTSIAWVACDEASCDAAYTVGGAGDAGVAISDAHEEGWASSDDADYCADHAWRAAQAPAGAEGAGRGATRCERRSTR